MANLTRRSTSTSAYREELLLSEKYSCCLCWNVVTGAFFIGIVGFVGCIFYLLSMALARLTYNIIPAAFGFINYSFLLVAQFSKRSYFYFIYITINVRIRQSNLQIIYRFSEFYSIAELRCFWASCSILCLNFISTSLLDTSKGIHESNLVLKVVFTRLFLNILI